MAEGNIKFDIPPWQFVVCFPRKKKMKAYGIEGITLKVRYYGHVGIVVSKAIRVSIWSS